MKKLSLLLASFVLVSMLSSCSVVMAAKKEGTNVRAVQECKTRNQFIARGGRVMVSERQADGSLIEIYQYKKEKGSAARAFMHGVLDVSTLGLWEVVGTPIEALDKTEFFCIKVVYDANDNVREVLLN